ncbi:hypothetical protein OS493_026284 [Desmophyllum pertusum]|uniref:Uncharacterized protein n=1 Tax=Desmophyllum pertusum TaxID=174260 RepID=A0A9W9ZMT3_9CNID|nr:hypothetical protein OS493_026284 [Desmophyllum pertusum]
MKSVSRFVEQFKVDSSAVHQSASFTDLAVPWIPERLFTGRSRKDTAQAPSTKSAPTSQGMKKADKERLELTRIVTHKNVELAERVKSNENERRLFSFELSRLRGENL